MKELLERFLNAGYEVRISRPAGEGGGAIVTVYLDGKLINGAMALTAEDALRAAAAFDATAFERVR